MSLRDRLWVIAAVVYVGGMFPIFYLYEMFPADRFGSLISYVTLISVIGSIGLLGLFVFFGALGSTSAPKEKA